MFIEQLVQRICRSTDNAQTMGRKNLTIKFLIEYTDFTTAPATKDRGLSPVADRPARILSSAETLQSLRRDLWQKGHITSVPFYRYFNALRDPLIKQIFGRAG